MYLFDRHPDIVMGAAIIVVAFCVISGIGAMG